MWSIMDDVTDSKLLQSQHEQICLDDSILTFGECSSGVGSYLGQKMSGLVYEHAGIFYT